MPETAKTYSITDLGLNVLHINVVSFKKLLKKEDFDSVVEHLALIYILK